MIDTHMHFGKSTDFEIKESEILEIIKNHDVDMGVVSNLTSCEFDMARNFIEKTDENSQLSLNKETLKFVKAHKKKLKGLFWIKPYTEAFTEELQNFYLENKNNFIGFKFHPFYSNITITDSKLTSYLEFASKHELTIAVHTASDYLSNPYHVYEAAKRYKKVKFILVHMGMNTDHESSIRYIKELDNVYGDTSWVNPDKVIKAIKECGSKKMLFGTDAAIDGVETYDKYKRLFEVCKERLTFEEQSNLFHYNAKRLFQI